MTRSRQLWLAMAVLAVILLAGMAAWAADGTRLAQVVDRNIRLVVNGAVIDADDEPIIMDGRTYVPIRQAAEALGMHVSWDPNTAKVVIQDVRPQVPVAELIMLDVRGDFDLEEVAHEGQRVKVRTLVDSSRDCDWYRERCYYEFELNGRYRSLSMDLWYDHPSWEHRLRVLVDDREIAGFAIQRKDSEPKHVEADITGARRLRVETAVDPGGPEYVVFGEEAKLFIAGTVSP